VSSGIALKMTLARRLGSRGDNRSCRLLFVYSRLYVPDDARFLSGGARRWFLLLIGNGSRGVRQPVVEMDLAEDSALIRHKAALAQLGTKVASVWIGNYFAWITACAEAFANEIVKTELLRTTYFNCAIQR